MTHARHDERRAKETLLREKQELERLAQHYVDENKKLKQYVNNGTEQYGAMAKTAAEAEMEKARRDYKAAQESFDTDAILAAQEALFDAKSKLQQAQNFRPPPLQAEESAVQPRQQQTESVKPDEKDPALAGKKPVVWFRRIRRSYQLCTRAASKTSQLRGRPPPRRIFRANRCSREVEIP